MDSFDTADQARSGNGVARPDGASVWTDAAGHTWAVLIEPERITLAHSNDRMEFPASRWKSDISVSPHGTGFIVRFSTFQHEIGFMLSAQQAEPLLRVLGVAAAEPADPTPVAETAAEQRQALLWPKVSPLAVWALITSSLAFVPILGILPGVATVVLLILHRKHVRRARAWDHSRAVCRAAFIFLVAGFGVSIPATLWGWHSITGAQDGQLRRFESSGRAHPNKPRPSAESSRYATRRFAVSAANHGGDAPLPTAPIRAGGTATSASVAAQSVLQEEHNWGLIAAGLLVVLMSLTVHEAAHAITAWWLGDDFARRLGRVTLNPLAHIDPLGTVVLPLVLFVMGQPVFGWARPVPVRMELLPRWRRAHILVSLAGPGSNLLMASASLILMLAAAYILMAVGPTGTVTNFSSFSFFEGVTVEGFAGAGAVGALLTVLKLSFLINTLLAFFNLIPIPPLDGSWVLEHLFPRTFGPIYARLRSFGILLFVILIYTNVLQYLLWPAKFAIGLGVAVLHWCTPF